MLVVPCGKTYSVDALDDFPACDLLTGAGVHLQPPQVACPGQIRSERSLGASVHRASWHRCPSRRPRRCLAHASVKNQGRLFDFVSFASRYASLRAAYTSTASQGTRGDSDPFLDPDLKRNSSFHSDFGATRRLPCGCWIQRLGPLSP